jgi:hypothetical protein
MVSVRSARIFRARGMKIAYKRGLYAGKQSCKGMIKRAYDKGYQAGLKRGTKKAKFRFINKRYWR